MVVALSQAAAKKKKKIFLPRTDGRKTEKKDVAVMVVVVVCKKRGYIGTKPHTYTSTRIYKDTVLSEVHLYTSILRAEGEGGGRGRDR